MLRRIWQRIVQFFRRLFGSSTSSQSSRTARRKKQAYLSLMREQRQAEPPKSLENADYEFLFMQLLEGVAHGWQQHRVLKFMAELEGRTTEEQWVLWLRGFGEKLVVSPTRHQDLAVAMLQLAEVGCGELGEVAGEIGRDLLERLDRQQPTRQIPTNLNPLEVVPVAGMENFSEEVEPISLDRLWDILQQDTDLAQQMAEIFEVPTTDPQSIIKAVINQGTVAPESTTEDAEFWFNQGLREYEAGDFEGAIASFDRVVDLKPDDSETWYNRGNALSELGRLEDAIASFDRAIEIKPDDYDAWNDRGITLHDLGKLEEAIASFDRAIEIKPENYDTWNDRAITLHSLGQYEEAVASFDRAVAIEPDYQEAWNNRGIVLSKLGRYEEAIASFDKALEIKVDKWEAWINRGAAAATSLFFDPLLASSSAIATQNPSLHQRSYEGQLASYQEGLKYVRQDTQPEGWAWLHKHIAQAYYDRGCIDSKPREYWRKAVTEYREALKTLTEARFPELHLEILQDLFKALLSLGQTAESEQLQRRGSDLLQRLLKEQNRSDWYKKQVALKFVPFNQLTVDLAVQSNQFVQALELAEKDKNACLTLLLDGWVDNISSPKWVDIQQLLNPTTAIVYWHLSPSALHTFILKHDAPEPIVLKETPVAEQTKFPSRAVEFENWVKDWNQQYQEYRSSKDKNHPWRQELEAKLTHIGNILDISEVIEELADISKLILIPHRDLHRFPLHYLFPDNFTITYLPSAKIGLNLKLEQDGWQTKKLLSVEYPDSLGLEKLLYPEIEAAAITEMFDNPTRLPDEDATKEQVIAALCDRHNIFHFTGHGNYNFATPKLSALALTGKDLLTLEDICQLPLSDYQLICLCACETAVTSNQTIATEYVGLVSGFLRQGASHVVSTLWTVPEDSSALLAIEFYQRLKANVPPAQALKEAQQWLRTVTNTELAQMYKNLSIQLTEYAPGVSEYLRFQAMFLEGKPDKINSSQPPYAHPYYWAAFTIAGR
mgnify:CR=1 FL=1